jgi:hypothetical protein
MFSTFDQNGAACRLHYGGVGQRLDSTLRQLIRQQHRILLGAQECVPRGIHEGPRLAGPVSLGADGQRVRAMAIVFHRGTRSPGFAGGVYQQR